MLTGHTERLPAGCQDPDSAAAVQHLGGELGAAVEDMLAVVEHKQYVLVPQMLQHTGGDRLRRAQAELEAIRYGLRHVRAMPSFGQLHEHRAVTVRAGDGSCDPPCQPRLADAASAGEGYQARDAQQAAHLGCLGRTADVAGRVRVEVTACHRAPLRPGSEQSTGNHRALRRIHVRSSTANRTVAAPAGPAVAAPVETRSPPTRRR